MASHQNSNQSISIRYLFMCGLAYREMARLASPFSQESWRATATRVFLRNILSPLWLLHIRIYRLWQANDPKHMSKSTREWMGLHWIMAWPTPPESPDLNPIERIWSAMKHHIRRSVEPSTKLELTDGIRQFWATVTPEMMMIFRFLLQLCSDTTNLTEL